MQTIPQSNYNVRLAGLLTSPGTQGKTVVHKQFVEELARTGHFTYCGTLACIGPLLALSDSELLL